MEFLVWIKLDCFISMIQSIRAAKEKTGIQTGKGTIGRDRIQAIINYRELSEVYKILETKSI